MRDIFSRRRLNGSLAILGKSVKDFKGYLLKGFKEAQNRYLIALSLAVGLATGGATYLFHCLIELVTRVSVGDPQSLLELGISQRALRAFWPALGGLFVGGVMYFLSKADRAGGVPEVIYSLRRKGGQIRGGPTIVKSLCAVVTLGSGGSAGPEGPVAEIGAAVGSFLGRVVALPPHILRMLVAGGAAGGIAASFQAPIGGVFFALEVILTEFTPQAFSMVVLSSVTATIVVRSLMGNTSYFNPQTYALGPSWELILYAGLGLASGLFSKIFVLLLDGVEQIFSSLKRFPAWSLPALGGILVGGLAILTPQVLGMGHSVIEQALRGNLAFNVLLALLLAKTLATSITLGSKGVGGVFLPGFFVGAMLGGTYGLLVKGILVNFGITHISSSGAYALVGMAALVAGATRAPITAIIMIFEITNDYQIILPVMIASVLSTLVARSIEGRTIYTLKLTGRGLKERELREIRPLESMMVREVMTKNVMTVSPALPLNRLARLVETKGHSGFPVVNSTKNLVGLVTFEELRAALGIDDLPRSAIVVGDLMRSPAPVVSEDVPLGEALRQFSELHVDRLAVVARGQPNRLMGIVTKADVLSVYHKLLTEPA